jgi:hypothetical protein
MAITFSTTATTGPATAMAVVVLVRAAAGLAFCGLRHFGRPSCIARRTGRVRPL